MRKYYNCGNSLLKKRILQKGRIFFLFKMEDIGDFLQRRDMRGTLELSKLRSKENHHEWMHMDNQLR